MASKQWLMQLLDSFDFSTKQIILKKLEKNLGSIAFQKIIASLEKPITSLSKANSTNSNKNAEQVRMGGE